MRVEDGREQRRGFRERPAISAAGQMATTRAPPVQPWRVVADVVSRFPGRKG